MAYVPPPSYDSYANDGSMPLPPGISHVPLSAPVPADPLKGYHDQITANLLASLIPATVPISTTPQQRRYEALRTHREEAKKTLEEYQGWKAREITSYQGLKTEYQDLAKNPPFSRLWKIVILALFCFGAHISKKLLTEAKISKLSALIQGLTLPALGMGAAWLWYKVHQANYTFHIKNVDNTLIILRSDKKKVDDKLKAFDNPENFVNLLEVQRSAVQGLPLPTADEDLLSYIYLEEKKELEAHNAVIPHS